MDNYTPERLDDLADKLEDATYGVEEMTQYAESAAPMLRAYAATLRQQAGRVDAFAPIPEAKEAPTDELWNAYSAFNERYRGFNTQQALRDAINTVLANRATLADGMVLVPREPTPKMIEMGRLFSFRPEVIWKNMLTVVDTESGAPTAPAHAMPDSPLSVFSKGYWTYTGTGESFDGGTLDQAAFDAYRDHFAAAPSQRAEVK